MTCKMFSKLLKDYIVGELFQGINEVMTMHMDKCERCKQEYNEQLEAYNFIQSKSLIQNIYFISSREYILKNIDKTRYIRRF